MKFCKLCNGNKKLIKSHIIPEFCYKPLYDESHRFPGCSDAPNGNIDMRQKGIYEKMLCEDCEKILSKYESYVRNFLYGKNGIIKNKDTYILVDYQKFKMFALSILWRAGIANEKSFQHVQLGKSHEEKLQKMILSGEPGKYYEYGFFLSYNIDDDEKIIDNLINNPDWKRIRNGHNLYRFLFSGIWWMFFVSNHEKSLSKELFSLKEDGRLIIYEKKLSENPHFITYSQKLMQQPEKLEKLKKYSKRS